MDLKHKVDPLGPSRDRQCAFLEWPEKDEREPVRYAGGQINFKETYGSHISIGGLTTKERDALEACLNGTCYVGVHNGRLYAWEAYEPLPDAISDPLIANHWRPTEERKIGGKPPGEGWHSPDITVQHPMDERSIQMLIDFGFECLRSKRAECGQFWEIYWLPLWKAKGKLKTFLDKWSEKNKESNQWMEKAEAAARFIVEAGCKFGTLDISIQRWALANPD